MPNLTSHQRRDQADYSRTLRVSSRPTPAEILICLLLAGIVVSLDVVISSRFGLLAYPPMNDGLGYMAGAKSLYYAILHFIHNSGGLEFNWALLHAPLWVTLMSATFFVFGEGEWQSHVVRIWPLSLLFLLMFWFVRRRWNSRVAWFAVGTTAMLPIAVPALAACAWGIGKEASFVGYFLGDPRPDFLAAVLLVWAVSLVLDNLLSPKRVYFIYSGLAMGLACLTKPSAMPAFIIAWSLVWMYFLAANVRSLNRAVGQCILSVSTAGITLIPYLAMGGYGHVKEYVFDVLVSHSNVWSKASSPLAEVAYYWVWFENHLWIGGWVMLIAGLCALVITFYRNEPIDRVALSYLGIAAAWYLLVTATKSKNPFLGIPFYLFVCLFSWATISGPLRSSLSRASRALLFVAVSLGTLLIAVRGGLFLARNWHEPPPIAGRNKEVLQQIAIDLKTHLEPGETFSAGDWCTYAGGVVPYYSIYEDGRQLYADLWQPYQGPEQINEFIDDRVAKTRAALLWKEDIEEVSESVMAASLPAAYDYYRSVHRWINRPGSAFELIKDTRSIFLTAP